MDFEATNAKKTAKLIGLKLEKPPSGLSNSNKIFRRERATHTIRSRDYKWHFLYFWSWTD